MASQCPLVCQDVLFSLFSMFSVLVGNLLRGGWDVCVLGDISCKLSWWMGVGWGWWGECV